MEKIKSFVILILLLLVAFAAYSVWQTNKANSGLSGDVIDLVNEKNTLTSEINEKGEELASVNSLVLKQSKELSEQASEIDRLQTLSSQTRVITNTVFSDVEVPIIDTLIVENIDTVYVRSAAYSDEWLTFRARVLPSALKLDTVSITNRFTLEIGYEKQGLFKKPVPRAYLLSENPYTRTNEITSIQFEAETPWHQRKGLWLVTGLIGGFVLNNQLK